MEPVHFVVSATMQPRGHVLPSTSQIALAVAVLRAKPDNLSARDYILQLRAQLRTEPITTGETGNCLILDHATYWQERCKRAEDQCEKLRKREEHLLLSNQKLSNRSETAQESKARQGTSKRKATTAPSGRSSKKMRAELQEPTVGDPISSLSAVEHDIHNVNGLSEEGSGLTLALFTAHSLYKSSEPAIEALISSLMRCVSALKQFISSATRQHIQLLKQDQSPVKSALLSRSKDEFSLVISACAKSFQSILVGVAKLVNVSPDVQHSSQFVSALAEVFRSALSSLENLTQNAAHDAISKVSQAKHQKSKGSNEQSVESPVAAAVAKLLMAFMASLDKTDAVHQNIFDGFMFILLECAGKRLYYCAFGHHRRNSIDENILPPAKGSTEAEKIQHDADVLGRKSELNLLVAILRKAMSIAPNYMNTQPSQNQKVSKPPARTISFQGRSRAQLSSAAKSRLQRTLLCCMYGSDTTDEFLDILSKPAPAIRFNMQVAPKSEEQNTEEWYKQELWRLIGWDVLTNGTQRW